jgi:hypothetical protein
MTRNLRAFGLALIAAVALGAIGAQAASAVTEHSFRAGDESMVLTGQTKNVDVLALTPGLTVECTATFEGTNVGTIQDTLTVHPTYSGCAGSVTVHTDGCNFILDTETTTSAHSGGGEHAPVSLECEAGHAIEVTRPGCNLAFPDESSSSPTNQSLHGVRYTNLSNHSGKNAGTVTATVKTIHYVVTSGSFCGLAGHQAGTYSSGIYNGGSTVTGYAHGTVVSGSATEGRTWSHGAQIDISISSPT